MPARRTKTKNKDIAAKFKIPENKKSKKVVEFKFPKKWKK